MGGDIVFDEKYYLDLITQDPINYNGLVIHQPSFEDIKKYGIENYNQVFLVYRLTLDCFDLSEKDGKNLFEDILLNDKSLLSCLSESLYLLTNASVIYLAEDMKSLKLKFNSESENQEDQYFIIDANNFDDICDIILKINASQKIEIEKPPENMSPRQRDVWEKLQEGRRKDKEKNELRLYDVLNVCEFCGDYRIPIDELKKWSLWRIMNCYKIRIGIKSFDDNLQIALVNGDSKLISDKQHWYQQLMVRE